MKKEKYPHPLFKNKEEHLKEIDRCIDSARKNLNELIEARRKIEKPFGWVIMKKWKQMMY